MSLKSIWLPLIALALLISACGPAATAAPTETASLPPAPTVTVVPPTPTVEPSPTPTEVVVADYCIDCHTDKEQLISTSKEVVAVEKESEGVG